MRRNGKTLALLALALAACGGDGGDRPRSSSKPPITAVDPMDPANVEIGPVIDGRNISIGPRHPSPHPDGWSIDISPAIEPHYVTWRHGPLAGKTHIVISGRLEAAEGVTIYPKCCPASPSMITPYFAASNNDWRTDGRRWWASFATLMPIPSGPFTITAPFDGPWTSVLRMTAANNPREFQQSLYSADRVGFTLGGGDGLGHGIRATGPAKLIITSIRVE